MTRRSKSWKPNSEKNLVDIPSAKGVPYQQGDGGSSDKANQEGVKIDDDVWSEFIPVAQLLLHRNSEADLYDLFDWVRVNFHGGQPYGDGLLARVDSEIKKELGPWDTN